MSLLYTPRSRNTGLVVQELKDEILIYDLDVNKAFCLNETSALIWQLCDGLNSVSDISKKLSKRLKSKVDEDLVLFALDKLQSENLLDHDQQIENRFAGLSRREVIKHIGLTSMVALPLISVLVAPAAVSAQSFPPICFNCVKTSDGIAACANCNGLLGTCYDNSGCGGGALVGSWTCTQCFDGTASAAQIPPIPFNGRVSWAVN